MGVSNGRRGPQKQKQPALSDAFTGAVLPCCVCCLSGLAAWLCPRRMCTEQTSCVSLCRAAADEHERAARDPDGAAGGCRPPGGRRGPGAGRQGGSGACAAGRWLEPGELDSTAACNLPLTFAATVGSLTRVPATHSAVIVMLLYVLLPSHYCTASPTAGERALRGAGGRGGGQG